MESKFNTLESKFNNLKWASILKKFSLINLLLGLIGSVVIGIYLNSESNLYTEYCFVIAIAGIVLSIISTIVYMTFATIATDISQIKNKICNKNNDGTNDDIIKHNRTESIKIEDIEKYKQLLNDDIITQEEYDLKMKKLLK